MNTQKRVSVTVGIPTCYGGDSLVETAKSLRRSVGIADFRFIIVADRTPLSDQNRSELKKLGVELTWNPVEGSQHKKLNQIVAKLDSDIFVFTQDDITFEPDTIAKIVKLFTDHPEVTMTSTHILPLPPETFFEHIMSTGITIVDRIATRWNHGQNYLMASGRCLAFKTTAIKKFRIPNQVVNGDMYLYLENKRTGGTFLPTLDARVYIRAPQHLKDQVGPSSRFQYQREELQNYFDFAIAPEYDMPRIAFLSAFLDEFLANPLFSVLYIGLFTYTRLFRQARKIVVDPVWKVDSSTKKVSHR